MFGRGTATISKELQMSCLILDAKLRKLEFSVLLLTLLCYYK